jgi:gamma-glutamylcyclotransferase (GGCT)/AIG2-like uncharacterized protein YtfP
VQKGSFVFVYGTLRRGQPMDIQKNILSQHSVKFISEDYINGKMYHIGAYPGVKATPQPTFNESLPWITGEVFLIRDNQLSAILDAYEGYQSDNPSLGLYDRIETATASGKTVWLYTFNPMVTSDQLIESGDWCKNPSIEIQRRHFG